MAFSLSWAFGSLTVAGISLSLVFAFAVSLWASWALFIPEALCISFAASLSLKPALIPAILAASFVAGLLWKYSVSLASFAALAVSVSFSVFALGPSALSEYGAELIVVCAVFAPCAKFGILPRPSPNSGESFVPADESEVRLEESRRTVREMSECFSAIGRLASSVSRVLSRPSEAEIRENVQHTFDLKRLFIAFIHIYRNRIGRHSGKRQTVRQTRGKLDIVDSRGGNAGKIGFHSDVVGGIAVYDAFPPGDGHIYQCTVSAVHEQTVSRLYLGSIFKIDSHPGKRGLRIDRIDLHNVKPEDKRSGEAHYLRNYIIFSFSGSKPDVFLTLLHYPRPHRSSSDQSVSSFFSAAPVL